MKVRVAAAAVLPALACVTPAAGAAEVVKRDRARDVGRGGLDSGEVDEWGRARDTMRISYRFEHAGPGAGLQNVGLDWSTSWM